MVCVTTLCSKKSVSDCLARKGQLYSAVVLQMVDGSLMNERIEDNECTHCFLEFILLTKLLKVTKHVCMNYFLNNKNMNFSLKNHEFFFFLLTFLH